MRKFLLLLLFIGFAHADWMQLDKDHTNVGFVAKHLGIANVAGRFEDYDAAIDFNKTTNTIKSLEAVIKVSSINTQNRARDNNLTKEIFFDTKKVKSIVFKMTGDDRGVIYGDLRIKNITKPVKLNYIYNGVAQDDTGVTKYSFSFVGDIKRKDFDVGKDYPTALISDDVRIVIDVEASLRK
ncbi:YceI family protein [Campylobacter mucosalis]|uniref:Putative periplasmic protein (YceI-like domain) n=1 Tax=Campylobacter mucosalis CCUG 21559 TaxID=1032067 RepID=A0A6G5QED2_9BACT|nr:YceI family protein [Campylobacter mucosalis]QCD44040.1 putative periplasmic protein (YceI-like domain) [Campylobacter mucosalis CCUG 21559]